MSNDLPQIGNVTTVEIDGLRIRVAHSGKSAGIPIVLTSPWPESIYAFRDVIPKLAELAPTVAIDLPGFGVSEGRVDLMSPKAMAGFIVKAAEHLGIKKMHAVGPDIGAIAFLFAAEANPELFESLIVGSGATSPELAAGGLVDLIASSPGTFAEMEGGDIGTGFVKAAAARPTPTAVMEDYRNSSLGRRFDEAADFVRAYSTELPVLRKLLPSIQTPVFILAGLHDLVVPPANGQLLKDHLPRSRYELLEGGHLIWEDASEQYAASIYDWVSDGYRTVLN